MNKKKIIVNIDTPTIPSGLNITHIGTSWQVSRFSDLSDKSYFIYESLNDTTNLLSNSIDIGNVTDSVYVRIKYHFSNNKSSAWSIVVPVRPDQKGIMLSNIIVATPIVTIGKELNYTKDSRIEITSTDMVLYAGVGKHKYSSWVVTDVDNNIVYERLMDETNLTELSISSKLLLANKAYIIKVKHITDTNIESHYGKITVATQTNTDSLFELTTYGDIVPNRYMHIDLAVYTTNAVTLDLIIKDETGEVVASSTDQLLTAPRIFTGNLIPYQKYSLWGRITISKNGERSKTPYCLVKTQTAKLNKTIDINKNISYLGKYSYEQELSLNGPTTQSVKETLSGDIFLTKHNDTKLYRYKYINGVLTQMDNGTVFYTGAKPLGKQNISITPLHSGRILVDLAEKVVSGKFREHVLMIFDYNPITKILFKIKEKKLSTTKYIGAESTAAVPMPDNRLYYTNRSDNRIDVFNLDTLEVVESITVPNIKLHTSLIAISDTKIMIIGGTPDNPIQDTTSDKWKEHVDYWVRDVDTATILDVISKTTDSVPVPGDSLKIDKYVSEISAGNNQNITSFPGIPQIPDNTDLDTLSIGIHDAYQGLSYSNGFVDGLNSSYIIDVYNNAQYAVIHFTANSGDVGKKYQRLKDSSGNWGSWSNVTDYDTTSTFADTLPNNVYQYQGYLRRDGKVILFNSVQSGPEVGNQDVYIYDPVAKTFHTDKIDEADNLIYRNTIQLNNGDFLRISSRTKDPQKIYKYVSDTITAANLKDNDTLDTVHDLVIEPGETIYIETPYRYNSILIKGTSLADTGKLIWVDGSNLREFNYKDKIVTRTTDITNNLYSPEVYWDRLTTLLDTSLTVHDIIDIPDNKTFSTTSPFSVDSITIGDGATFTVNGV